MRKIVESAFVSCVAILTLLVPVRLQADEAAVQLEKKSVELYQQVLSPFCPGRSLNDCPSSKAQELKDEMRHRLEAGEAEEQILEDVFQRFGSQFRAVPVFAGIGVFVWLVPIAFVVFGLMVALAVSIGRKQPQEATTKSLKSSSASPLSESQSKRLQDELNQLD